MPPRLLYAKLPNVALDQSHGNLCDCNYDQRHLLVFSISIIEASDLRAAIMVKHSLHACSMCLLFRKIRLKRVVTMVVAFFRRALYYLWRI